MSNPAGNYSRLKTWGTSDTILAADLNAEFNNVLNNFNPEMLAAYSQNQAQMQIQTSPGGVGSESLATSIAGELERLRFMLASIMGTTYWYQSPASNINQLTSAIGTSALNNSITSGLTNATTGSSQPIFLLAANTTNTVTLKATSVPLVFKVQGSTFTIVVDTAVNGLSKAPGTSNTVTVSDLTLAAADSVSNKLYGENGGTITTTSMGTLSLTTGELYCFKTTAGEYLLARYQSATQLVDVRRGFFFNSSNALVSRGTLANGDTLTLMKLNYIFATTSSTLTSYSGTNPLRVGGLAPASPNTGDFWFDTSVNYWKTFQASTWASANATLIGSAVCDASNCVVTRSYDFFNTYSSLNSLELYTDENNSSTKVRSRQTGGQLSVYGTTVQYGPDYTYWDFTTDLDTGSIAASTYYYLYVDKNGKSIISLTAPTDRRGDLLGYYHPGNTYRCVGYVFVNALTQVQEFESFYRSDNTTATSYVTAAQQTPHPYDIVPIEQVISIDSSSASITQQTPPPYMWKGKTITYIRTDNSIGNVVTLTGWGTQVLSTTGTINFFTNNTTISTMASTTGIVAGQLISGLGIQPNTTVSSVSAGTVIMSKSAMLTIAGVTVTFANVAGTTGTVGGQTAYANYGINGQFSTTLNTLYESVDLYSDGYAVFIKQRRIPSNNASYVPTYTGFGVASNINVRSWREGRNLCIEGSHTNGTATVTGATFTLGWTGTNNPGGLSLDAQLMGTVILPIGIWGATNTVSINGFMLYQSASGVNFGQIFSGGAASLQTANGSSLGTGTGLGYNMKFPIAGWND